MEPDGMDLWKTIFLYNPVLFRFHVNLPECRGPYKQPTLGIVPSTLNPLYDYACIVDQVKLKDWWLLGNQQCL